MKVVVQGKDVRVGDMVLECTGKTPDGLRSKWQSRVVEPYKYVVGTIHLEALTVDRATLWFLVERAGPEVNEWGEVSP